MELLFWALRKIRKVKPYLPGSAPSSFEGACNQGNQGVAGTTGLEPATSDVTGRRSNQLNYVPLL